MLAQNEAAGLDSEKLEALYRQLGDSSAEDVVCRAMEELALRLSQVERYFRANEIDEMRKGARSIAAIAEQIGMAALSRVAQQLHQCASTNDTVAQAAVLARLIRVGERSLMEIWELQDLSI
ncbi:hypothetical protein [Rhodalgimonas zhirmunskyi]|uniref:HPt domain-containing protein n=1 Tax=Rhodalgimonas zhirmunskyi TaxID=2964767 RepID=A0AAJ1U984_9RHOB|nr:hypothetical protein [Rhodoalgimonas zhirmunskyi]MDQ2094125.1 hypothetical protein [Rhodoalgimonas zhirmunskyi]